MARLVRYILCGTALLVVIGLGAIKLIYGGGVPYPSIATEPVRSNVERAIELPLPPGMVAVGADGRVFFTYHPFHRPQDHTDHLVFEWRDDQAVPVAPGLVDRLHGVFGITVDARGWLWMVRPGAMEGRPTEVLAVNPDNGVIEFEHAFPDGAAGFAQDLRVTEDGRHVILADTGLLRFTPASLIILDTEARSFRTILENHETTAPQNWVMRRPDGSNYKLGFGLVTFQVGVDGIEISNDGEWLIYAAMTHDGVYRVPLQLLLDAKASPEELEGAIERLGPGPMSDGIALDDAGAVILTDVENDGLALLRDGELQTLVRVDGVDWADSVSVAPNGDIWFTDSRLTALLGPFGQPAEMDTMTAAAPYAIYRIPRSE